MFIDLMLDFNNEKDKKIAEMFNVQREKEIKGKEFVDMPFFLSDDYK
jgi:hypothetical protein